MILKFRNSHELGDPNHSQLILIYIYFWMD